MDNLRHKKYKNKQLENNSEPINICILTDIVKFEKRRSSKEEIIYNEYRVLLRELVN